MQYIIPEKVYKVLKWGASIVMPALTTLVGAVMAAWDVPYATPVMATMTVVTAFMGAVMGVSQVTAKSKE